MSSVATARRGETTILRELAVVTRDELVDAAAATALVVLGLLGLKTTYGDYRFLIGGVLGLVAGVAIAHLAGKLRFPVVATAATVVVAFFILSGVGASRGSAIGGVIPTGTTIRQLVDGGVHGWADLLTLLPPVPSSGPLLVIPYFLGMAAGAGSYALARRTRSVALPLLPAIAVLVTGILFGTHEPVSVVLQGAVFAVVALGWMAIRHDRRYVSTVRSARRLRRIGLAAVLVLAAGAAGRWIGPHLPFAAHPDRTVIRTYVEPPSRISDLPSPLASFRHYILKGQLGKRTLLTVKGVPAGTLLRFATMDAYDGTVWRADTSAVDATGSFRRVGRQAPLSQPGAPVDLTVTVGDYSDVWVPTAGEIQSISFLGKNRARLTAGYRYSIASSTAFDAGRLQKSDGYVIHGVIPEQTSQATAGAGAPDGSPLPLQNVDTSTIQALNDTITLWAPGETDPGSKLTKVASFMKANGRWSSGEERQGEPILPGHYAARLVRFVRGTQLVGNDEQYAATFALMGSLLGYPSRVVLGAKVGAGGVVKGEGVTAWPEVRMANFGWVPFAVSPDRTRLPDPNPPQEQTNTRAPNRVPPPQAAAPPTQESSADTSPARANKKQQPVHHGLSPAVKTAIRVGKVGGPPILAIVLAILAIIGLKISRRKRRRTRGTPAERVSGGWREIVDLAVDLGAPRPPRDTRRVVARQLGATPLVQLAYAADAVNFGPEQADDGDATRYWRSVEETRAQLLAQVGRRRRMAAALSLASFGIRLRGKRRDARWAIGRDGR